MINIKVTSTCAIILVAWFIIGVSAFGPGSVYTESHPFSISPGETKTLEISLANNGGSDIDRTVMISLIDGDEIASVDEGEVFLSRGDDKMIPVTISVPKEVPVGTAYSVKLSFRDVGGGEEGTVGLGLSIDYTFTVQVAAPSEAESKSNLTAWIIGIIIVIVAIFIVVRMLGRRPVTEEVK